MSNRQAQLRTMMAEQGGRCFFCRAAFRATGGQRPTIDHLEPLWLFGRYGRKAAVCHDCNRKKGPLDAETFARVRFSPEALQKAKRRAMVAAHLYSGHFTLRRLPEMVAIVMEDE